MLIYPRHDPRFQDKRLYKGGDGGAGQMRADEQARQDKVQAAVDAINAKFGIGSGGTGATAMPTREQFTKKGASSMWVPGAGQGEDSNQGGYYGNPGQDVFDEAGYNKALEAAKAQVQDVSAAKDAREKQYADISAAVRDTALRDLDRQYSKASNQNLFGLARSGLLGGSVDAESGGELSTLYGEGRLKAEQQGVGAAADLRASDEKTRSNLISLAQSGLDTGTAASMAAGQMAAAADAAKANANAATVGDTFGNLSQAYLTNKVLQARYPNGLPQSGSGGYFTNVFNPGAGNSGRISK